MRLMVWGRYPGKSKPWQKLLNICRTSKLQFPIDLYLRLKFGQLACSSINSWPSTVNDPWAIWYIHPTKILDRLYSYVTEVQKWDFLVLNLTSILNIT